MPSLAGSAAPRARSGVRERLRDPDDPPLRGPPAGRRGGARAREAPPHRRGPATCRRRGDRGVDAAGPAPPLDGGPRAADARALRAARHLGVRAQGGRSGGRGARRARRRGPGGPGRAAAVRVASRSGWGRTRPRSRTARRSAARTAARSPRSSSRRAGARGAVYDAATHCRGIGDAVALAMQDAGAKLVTGLGTDPGRRRVARRQGHRARPRSPSARRSPIRAPASPCAAADEYRPYELDPSTVAAARRAARPTAAAAPARRCSRHRRRPCRARPSSASRLGVFRRATQSAGQLERPGTGVAFTHARRGVAATRGARVHARRSATLAREYSGKTLPSPGGFAVPRGIFLGSTAVGLGVRGILPGGRVEPWVGATALSSSGPSSRRRTRSSGFTGSGDPSGTAWSAGVDVGAGLLFYVGRGVQLGIEVRRLFSRASFDPFPGSVPIGGVSTSLTFGAALQ